MCIRDRCIGKTDQSIIIPTKYMVMNFIVVSILESNPLRNDGELLEKACPNICLLYTSTVDKMSGELGY